LKEKNNCKIKERSVWLRLW